MRQGWESLINHVRATVTAKHRIYILTVSIPVTAPAGFSTLLQFASGVPEKHLGPV